MRTRALAVVAAAVALSACRRQATPVAAPPPAALRERVELSDGWRFFASDDLAGVEAPGFDDSKWTPVTLPHTWAKDDPRTHKAAWYRRHFALGDGDREKRIYLSFEGAATIADVFLNGEHLGQHRGAYTRFVFDATPDAHAGDNVVAVRVNNDPQDTADCLPSGSERQLYFVWGGLHRKVSLLKAPALHVDPGDLAGPGVYATPRNVTAAGAELDVRVLARNARQVGARFEVRARLVDAQGREAVSRNQPARLDAGGKGDVKLTAHLDAPHLWSPGDPYLYTLEASLREGGRVVDAVTQRVGFRDFRFDGKGFSLNGAPILLRGVGKHEIRERSLSAVSDDEIREDFDLLHELGVNAVRLAHYPHSELAYALADQKGLLVIAENGHSNPGRSGDTGDTITREMIRQNYNHASIVAWSVGNEAAYKRVFGYARIAREEDAQRVILYSSNTGVLRKKGDDLSLVAQNTYRGWYRGQPWDFEERALAIRFVTEAGGGSLVSTHTDYLDARHEVDRFEPEEYRQLLAEAQDQVVFRDHAQAIPLYFTWILRDFPIDKYKGAWNTKGLLTAGGLRKDAFALYRAFLKPDEAIVHVTSKSFFLRRGDEHNGVKVYSNRKALTLAVNGEARGARRNGEYEHRNGRGVANVFYWRTPLKPGRNEIAVSDGEGHGDRAIVYSAPGGVAIPEAAGALVRSLRSSNANNRAYFIDAPVQEQWPFYYDLDGTADNSFDRLPEPLRGAAWIATRRLSRPENRTELSFELARDARVLVVRSDGPAPHALLAAGFRETDVRGEWRDDALRLVPFGVWSRDARAGERIAVPPEARDYVVLLEAR
jgi:beta-galactosidase